MDGNRLTLHFRNACKNELSIINQTIANLKSSFMDILGLYLAPPGMDQGRIFNGKPLALHRHNQVYIFFGCGC